MSYNRFWTKESVVQALKDNVGPNGYVTYSKLGGGLRNAAEREFGTFAKACKAAGVKPRPRGRPSKTFVA